MGFSPKTFWGMTQVEFSSACNGYLYKHGKGGKESKPLTKDSMRKLMEDFPD